MQIRLGLLDVAVSVGCNALRQRLPQELRLISLDWARPGVRVTRVGSCVWFVWNGLDALSVLRLRGHASDESGLR